MSAAPAPKLRLTRADFVRFIPVPTRWNDNDVFGHANNVQYYSYFDTAVTFTLLEARLLDPATGPVIPVVVETTCTYLSSVAFPDQLEVGMAITRIGGSSLTYRLGVFRKGEDLPAAQGVFTHVYVTRADQRPVPLPAAVRAYAEGLVAPAT